MRKLVALMAFAVIAVAGQGVALGHACCLPDGSCRNGTLERCDLEGGTSFQGENCDVVVCEQPPTDCSPGYWKNHTEVWFGVLCDDSGDPSQCDDLLAAMQARGGGETAQGRHAAAAYLDEQWLMFNDYLPCASD